jgi:hypothetical protein
LGRDAQALFAQRLNDLLRGLLYRLWHRFNPPNGDPG